MVISPLAQLVERETVNLEAVGSTPTWREEGKKECGIHTSFSIQKQNQDP